MNFSKLSHNLFCSVHAVSPYRDTTVQTLTLQSSVLGGQIVYEDSPLVCLCVHICLSLCLHVSCLFATVYMCVGVSLVCVPVIESIC